MLRTKERPNIDAPGHNRLILPLVFPDDPAASAVQHALAVGLHWLGRNHPAAYRGDTDGVHHLRTTTRRLRSALDLYRPLTDGAWAVRLADELKWLGGVLGKVRDLDVLTARLDAAAREIDLLDSLGPLFDVLRDSHEQASSALREALGSERYDSLAEALAAAVGTIPLNEAAWHPCREALPPLVGEAWSRLKKAGRELAHDDPDEAFHDVRKHAKRARYAAEAVRDAFGSEPSAGARRFIRRAKAVQDILGAHQDAVVAASEVHRVALEHPDLGPFNFAAGMLVARECLDADASRACFFEVWPDLDRKKTTRWLKP
jgi:CHAD domain-containing protein